MKKLLLVLVAGSAIIAGCSSDNTSSEHSFVVKHHKVSTSDSVKHKKHKKQSSMPASKFGS